MLGSVFGDFDDGFYGGYPMTYRERQRQAEMERYRQYRQQQERLRQRQEEALRRKRAEEEYFQRLREAERQEKLRRQRMLDRRNPYPSYSVVRDPYGRVYRVPVDEDYEEQEEFQQPLISKLHPAPKRRTVTPPPKAAKQTGRPTYVRGRDGRVYIVKDRMDTETDDDDDDNEGYDTPTEMESETSSPSSSPPELKVSTTPSARNNKTTEVNVKLHGSDSMDTETSSSKNNKKPRRRVTVIVEDVTDEEEDETKSVWRNRRPGPGDSWIEPITPP